MNAFNALDEIQGWKERKAALTKRGLDLRSKLVEIEKRKRFPTIAINACDHVWLSFLKPTFTVALSKMTQPGEYVEPDEAIRKAIENLKKTGNSETLSCDEGMLEDVFTNNSPEDKAELTSIFAQKLSGTFTYLEFYDRLIKLRAEFEKAVAKTEAEAAPLQRQLDDTTLERAKIDAKLSAISEFATQVKGI